MKHLILAAFLAASPAYAGGPVILEDETVEAERPSSGIVPIIIGGIILCAIFCGGKDDPEPEPPKTCFTGC